MIDPRPPDVQDLGIAKQFDDIDREIARLATICKVDLLQPEVVDRILRNDSSVCGADNPLAFKKMREMVMLHYSVRQHAFETLGAHEAQAVVDLVVKRIREQYQKLGYGRK